MVGAEGTKVLILMTLSRWKRHFGKKNYIENYFYLLERTKSTKTQKCWRNIIWADFFGRPYCTSGIKTRLGSAVAEIARWFTEAAVRRCSTKLVFLKISQSSQENTRDEVFFNKVVVFQPATLLNKTPTQVFFCKFWLIFKNTSSD